MRTVFPSLQSSFLPFFLPFFLHSFIPSFIHSFIFICVHSSADGGVSVCGCRSDRCGWRRHGQERSWDLLRLCHPEHPVRTRCCFSTRGQQRLPPPPVGQPLRFPPVQAVSVNRNAVLKQKFNGPLSRVSRAKRYSENRGSRPIDMNYSQ